MDKNLKENTKELVENSPTKKQFHAVKKNNIFTREWYLIPLIKVLVDKGVRVGQFHDGLYIKTDRSTPTYMDYSYYIDMDENNKVKRKGKAMLMFHIDDLDTVREYLPHTTVYQFQSKTLDLKDDRMVPIWEKIGHFDFLSLAYKDTVIAYFNLNHLLIELEEIHGIKPFRINLEDYKLD